MNIVSKFSLLVAEEYEKQLDKVSKAAEREEIEQLNITLEKAVELFQKVNVIQ